MAEKKLLITPEVAQYREAMGSICPTKLAEVIGTPLHGIQQDVAKYFTKPLIHNYDIFTFLMSRRMGKSFLILKLIVSQLLTPNSDIGLVSHSTHLSDEHFSNIVRDLGKIPQLKDKFHVRKKEGIITIPSLNSRFICSSYYNSEARFVGKKLSIIYFEEYFLWPPEWQQIVFNLLSPTLTTLGRTPDGIAYGKIVIVSTPRGVESATLAGRIYRKGVNKEKGYISFTNDIYDSPFLSMKEIEDIEASTNPTIFKQEYLCQFAASSKTVFPQYNPERNVIPMTDEFIKDIASGSTLIVGMDIGINDGNAYSLVLHHIKSNTYYLIGEYYAQNELVRDYGKQLVTSVKDVCKKYDILKDDVIYFCDPSALAARAEISKDYDLSIHKAKNSRDVGYSYMNEMLQGVGVDPVPQLYLRDTCKLSQEMVHFAEFKIVAGQVTNAIAQDPSERKSHMELAVTLLYAVFSNFKTAQSQIILI